jgi:catechol 2,3-dioxygenase-like lactoylglutathione lyase family enzyme
MSIVIGLRGIHHVTAIAGDPQRNIDFYADALGLRLVKLTVNYDDPGSYHLYYGDAVGHPGTILTFFAWPGGLRGRRGTGQIAAISLSIPPEAVNYWQERLQQRGIAVEEPGVRFGEQVLALRDPDGLALELVAHPAARERSGWEAGPVPAAHAIRGVHAVTLWEEDSALTSRFVHETLGFRPIVEEGDTVRYDVSAGGPGTLVNVRRAPDVARGMVAVGTVHHVAWRTPSDEEQLAWRERIAALGAHVTHVLDRQYFHSIYFHEPGGVLFEIATDPPGFTVDEPPERLGTSLRLPAWLEPQRAAIERELPSVQLPSVATQADR